MTSVIKDKAVAVALSSPRFTKQGLLSSTLMYKFPSAMRTVIPNNSNMSNNFQSSNTEISCSAILAVASGKRAIEITVQKRRLEKC